MATQKFNTKEEFDKFLAANPTATGRWVDPMAGVQNFAAQRQAYQPNMVEQILMGITSPFTKGITGLAESTRMMNQGIGVSSFDRASDQQLSEYKPIYQTQDEYQQMIANPEMFAGQQIAGIASNFIPGGAGIKGLMKAGAVAGAGSAFANQDLREGLDVGNILGGAAMGGAGAGALGLAGKGLGKLAKGAKAVPELTSAGVLQAEGGATAALRGLDEFIGGAPEMNWLQRSGSVNKLKGAGLTTAGRDIAEYKGMAESLDRASKFLRERGISGGESVEEVSRAFTSLVRKAAEETPTTSIVDDLLAPEFISKVASNTEVSEPQARKAVEGLLKQVGLYKPASGQDAVRAAAAGRGVIKLKPVAATQLLDAKQKLFPMAQKLRASIDSVGAKPFTPKQRAVVDLYDMIKTKFDDVVPGAMAAENMNSFILSNKKNIGSTFVRGAAEPSASVNVGVQALNFLKNKMGDIESFVGDVAARERSLLPSGVASRAAGLTQPVAQSLMDIGATRGGQAAQGLARYAAPRLPGLMSNIEQPVSTQQPIDPNALYAERDLSAGFGDPRADTSAARRQMGIQLLSEGRKGSEVQAILDIMFGKERAGKKLSASQVNELTSAESGVQRLLDLRRAIQDYSPYFGPVQGGALGDVVGMFDADRNMLRQKVGILVQNIASALEGGKLSDKDRNYYLSMLPALTNDPQSAIKMVDDLIRDVEKDYQVKQNFYIERGYDI